MDRVARHDRGSLGAFRGGWRSEPFFLPAQPHRRRGSRAWPERRNFHLPWGFRSTPSCSSYPSPLQIGWLLPPGSAPPKDRSCIHGAPASSLQKPPLAAVQQQSPPSHASGSGRSCRSHPRELPPDVRPAPPSEAFPDHLGEYRYGPGSSYLDSSPSHRGESDKRLKYLTSASRRVTGSGQPRFPEKQRQKIDGTSTPVKSLFSSSVMDLVMALSRFIVGGSCG